jgi:hypothetical protein
MSDLFERQLTATDFLTDLLRYKDNRMTKAEITKRWKGQQWSNPELRAWALWNWRESGL